MKHTITFYTDDNEVKEIHDIRVTYFDQDDRVYCMNYKRSNKVKDSGNFFHSCAISKLADGRKNKAS
jgi:hypothetical protein